MDGLLQLYMRIYAYIYIYRERETGTPHKYANDRALGGGDHTYVHIDVYIYKSKDVHTSMYHIYIHM